MSRACGEGSGGCIGNSLEGSCPAGLVGLRRRWNSTLGAMGSHQRTFQLEELSSKGLKEGVNYASLQGNLSPLGAVRC